MTRPRRVLLVGWDGATWDVAGPLLDAGRLPHLAALRAAGFAAELRSTIPPVTPAAWTSLATGLSPGGSGVLSFRHLDLRRPSGYLPRLASSEDLRGRTLYEHASAHGVGVALLAHPMTWPPFDLPGGVLLAGWPRPETPEAPIRPIEAARGLGPWGAGAARPAEAGRTRAGQLDPEGAAEELDARTVRAALHFLTCRPDPLVFVGLQGPDHVAHRAFGSEALRRTYERCDRWLGELCRAAGPQTAVFVVSDHGFGPGPTARVHLGRALREAGLLQLRAQGGNQDAVGATARTLRHGLRAATWKQTRERLPGALRRWGYERAHGTHQLVLAGTAVLRVPLYEGFEGLVVQVDGRQRGGSVPPSEWAATRERAIAVVASLRDERGPLATHVWRREELYVGTAMDRLPDAFVALREDLTGGDQLGVGPLIERVERAAGEGSHRRAGIVAAAGPGLCRALGPVPLEPHDLLPTALALLDVPVPRAIDGRARADLLTRPPPSPIPVHGAARVADGAAPSDPARGMEGSLRALGYLS